MKVYILLKFSFNGYDTFHDIIDVYENEEDATFASIHLEEENTGEDVSFYVQEYVLK